VRVNLTAQFVKSVKAPEAGQIDYWDKRTSHFGLRVSSGGSKVWNIFYRLHGRDGRYTIGSYDDFSLADARQHAIGKLRDVAHGIDPSAAKRAGRGAETFGELAQLYLDRHAKAEKRTWREDERILDNDLLPSWKSRKAFEIKRPDVMTLLDSIVDRGSPIMANRTKALISKVFNFGIKRGVVEMNPAQGVDSPAPERQRDRVLSESEMRALWKALDGMPKKTAPIFRLALLTAQRRGEILGMAWSELDLDAGWWTIPAERAKNGLTHRVRLASQAVRILRSIQSGKHDEKLVFRGGRIGQPIANLQKPMRKLRKAAGEALAKEEGKLITPQTVLDFKFHDLRRTAASHMTGLGISRLVVSKILNHAEKTVTAVYDRHGYDAEKKAALDKWQRRLMHVVEKTSALELEALSA
jgi:integrase